MLTGSWHHKYNRISISYFFFFLITYSHFLLSIICIHSQINVFNKFSGFTVLIVISLFYMMITCALIFTTILITTYEATVEHAIWVESSRYIWYTSDESNILLKKKKKKLKKRWRITLDILYVLLAADSVFLGLLIRGKNYWHIHIQLYVCLYNDRSPIYYQHKLPMNYFTATRTKY